MVHKITSTSAFVFMLGVFILLYASFSFAGSDPFSEAGTPHTAFGKVEYLDHSIPSSVTFNAYITTRSADVLTQSSAGCVYNAGTGEWAVQCGNFSTNWTAGDVLHIDFDDGAGATGSDEITLTNNPFDNAGTTTLTRPTRQIIITTSPSGREFTVDGTTYSSAQTFNWEQGSTHPISVSSPQSGGAGTQYVYTSWSDGGAQSHTYTVPGSNQTVTANFKIQYYLTVNSTYGSPTGQNWYDAGSTANFGVTTPASGGAGTQYVFTGWTGSGSGSYTGGNASSSVTMNNPITETASWKTQYYLTVNSTYGSPTGQGWYDAGSSASFGVTTPASGGAGTRYVFMGWTGSGSGSYTGGSASSSVTMNNPITEAASWKTQYYLTVNSDYGSTTGENWYDAGSSASFSVSPTTVSGGSGTRYVFTGWTGSGSGSYTGGNASSSVTMNNPITEAASWKTQYYLTTAENPDAGGDMTPAPPGAWYDSGTDASVDATVNGGYLWAGWSVDLSGMTKPTTILMNGPKSVTANFGKEVQITVTTNPVGRDFTVDGTPYSSAQTFTWIQNQTYTISVSSPQSGGAGTQYVYTSWSDGGAQSHTYTVPGSNQTVTANFKTQYYLTVNSTYGSPTGQDWYDAGSSASFGVTTPVSGGAGTQYVFMGWTGSGSGSYTGGSASSSVTMNNPITETASWKTQYYLTVNSTYGSPTGQGWHDAGSSANFGVTTPASGGAGTRYLFTGWTGSGSGSYTGGNASSSVTMNNPITEAASWKTQYYLTTAENPDAGGDMTPAPPGAWYDSGTDASVNATVAGGYQWAGWSVDLSGMTKPTTILMNGPKSVTANFGKEVQITVTTNPVGRDFTVDGTPYSSAQTFTWIQNQTYTISVSSPQSGGAGTQYVYTSWSDGGARSHDYTVPGSNQTVTANFKTQNYLTVNSTYGSPTGQGWHDAGSSANFSVTSPAYQGDTRYIFLNWSGDYSGTNKSGSITMNNPKSVTASWKTQYYLDVSSDNGFTNGQGWYDVGAVASFSVTPTTVSGGTGTRYVFMDWTGNGSGSYSGSNESSFVTMNNPITETANWKTQYYLTTAENPDAGGNMTPAPPGGWYDAGETVTLIATKNPNYIFSGWSGNVTGMVNPTNIYMNGPKSVTANFYSDIDNTPPYLKHCYPSAGSHAVPKNCIIRFRAEDKGYGVALASLNLWVNSTSIISNGIDQTGGRVNITSHSPIYSVTYDPVSDFSEGNLVTVRVQCQDLSPTVNSLDTTYTFSIGTSTVVVTKTDTVGQTGGTVMDESNGIKITIPAGALDDTTEITIGTIDNPPPLPESVDGIGLTYHFGPDGLQFADSVTIRIPYTQADLNSAGVTNPMDLPVYYFSTTKGVWVQLYIFNADANYIYVKVKEFCYLIFGKVTSIGVEERELNMSIPTGFILHQNYPNPFNPETVVRYQIPKPGHVTIEVYNTMGQRIRTLVNGMRQVGTYEVVWDGRNEAGELVSNGMYLYVMKSQGYVGMMKALFMK